MALILIRSTSKEKKFPKTTQRALIKAIKAIADSKKNSYIVHDVRSFSFQDSAECNIVAHIDYNTATNDGDRYDITRKVDAVLVQQKKELALKVLKQGR